MSNIVITRDMEANYLDVGTKGSASFALMGAGFTKLDKKPAAKTSSKQYVNDKSATKTVTSYDWSTPFETDLIKEQEAVKLIESIGKEQKIGADAETDYVIVDLAEFTGSGVYSARKIRVAIQVTDFASSNGEMNIKGNLLGKGDMILGNFNTSTRTFTEGASIPESHITQ